MITINKLKSLHKNRYQNIKQLTNYISNHEQ